MTMHEGLPGAGPATAGPQPDQAAYFLDLPDSHLSLGEPWHAIGYLEACLPLLRGLGMSRHEGLARQHLDAGAAELAELVHLGRGGLACGL